MPDVTADSLKILERSSDVRHMRSWSRNFHQQHWGQRNGARITFVDEGAVSRAIDCFTSEESFGLVHKSPLLVRKSYVELWDYLWATYLGFEQNVVLPSGATIVYGHPGIGKSVSLLYLMCAAAEAKVPFVFHRAGTNAAFVCLNDGQFFIPVENLPGITFVKRALVLIDSTQQQLSADAFDVSSAHVVLASSPAPARYKDLLKLRTALFFTMSLVHPAEFRAILHLRIVGLGAQHQVIPLTKTYTGPADALVPAEVLSWPVDPVDLDSVSAYGDMTRMDVDLADASVTSSDAGNARALFHAPATVAVPSTSQPRLWDPLRVFELCGPNLHIALSPKIWHTGSPLELLGATTWQVALQNSISSLSLLTGLSSKDSFAANTSVSGYHTLFFEQPDSTGAVGHQPPTNPVIPTPFLRSVVYAAVRTAQRLEQLKMLGHVRGLGAIHGIIFEAAALDYLSTARLTAILPSSATSFVVAPQDSSARPYVVNPPSITTARMKATPLPYAGNAKGLDSIADQLGFCTLPSGFASADALMIAQGDSHCRFEILFQVTVSKVHPIKQAGVNSVLRALDRHRRTETRRVFLFVSDSDEKGRSLATANYKYLDDWEIGYVTIADKDLLNLSEDAE
ncbi:hypothetical protein AURDEDRAFT_188318 [Auricularia subglabra TFB-10046 SS5]|nr:hypothetical protein AURDEDRAFT_188318 [Auricularia subglabra TFB-10046 SS5]